MCGHVGVFGAVTEQTKKAFKWLHILDRTRGEDSSGIALVRKDNSTEVLKEVGTPDLLTLKYPEKFSKGVIQEEVICLIGHNRFKTQGAISADNAHPFEFDNVIGAHNGTITQYYTNKLFDADKFEIDSQKLFSQLNNDPEAGKLWEHLPDSQSSAAALVWWDKRTNSLNFLRNSQRPFHILRVKGKETILWASEKWMLTLAASLCGIDDAGIYSTIVNSHYKVTFENNKLATEVTKVEPYTFPSYSGSTIPWIGSNYQKKAEKKIFLELKEEHPSAQIPTLIFTTSKSEEVHCRVHSGISSVWEKLKELQGYLEKEDTVMVEIIEDRLWHNAAEKITIAPAYIIEKALDEEIEWQKSLKDAEEKYDKKKSTLKTTSTTTTTVSCSGNIAIDELGLPIRGKMLRKRLKAAGNICSHCLQEVYPRYPISNGGMFTDIESFTCGMCMSRSKAKLN